MDDILHPYYVGTVIKIFQAHSNMFGTGSLYIFSIDLEMMHIISASSEHIFVYISLMHFCNSDQRYLQFRNKKKLNLRERGDI